MLPPRLVPEPEVLLLLESRRGACNRETAVGREVDHTGIVHEETALPRTADAER
jgi:hypothetical protein